MLIFFFILYIEIPWKRSRKNKPSDILYIILINFKKIIYYSTTFYIYIYRGREKISQFNLNYLMVKTNSRKVSCI